MRAGPKGDGSRFDGAWLASSVLGRLRKNCGARQVWSWSIYLLRYNKRRDMTCLLSYIDRVGICVQKLNIDTLDFT